MSLTARELISRSFYLANIVSRGLQSVTGEQAADGLYLLNALLDWKSIDIDLIPYWTYYEFNTVEGQEKYTIPNLYAVESLTFNQGVIRFPTSYTMRTEYFGTGRVDNISSLPFNWTFNQEVGGGSIYLYFLPQQVFTIKIMGKFGLQDVSLDTDLLEVYDRSYIEYLRYALANYICQDYNIPFNPESRIHLANITRQLLNVSPPDLSRSTVSILRKNAGLNYADMSIGQGWRPL
jgi:hypothetical protein